MDSRLKQLFLALMGLAIIVVLVSLYDPLRPRVAGLGAEALSSSGLEFAERSPAVDSLGQRIDDLQRENALLRQRLEGLDDLGARLEQLESRQPARLLHDYSVPSEVEYCGERLPLEDPQVYGRFEAEFHRFLVNRHWVIQWMRRSRDVFPYVEGRLAEAGMPEDLKYMAVIESALDPRATSSAGAAGFWQFTRSTGQRYGLTRSRTLDERRDLREATDAAISYLQELREEFGSWPLALSGYNAGENRVRDAIKEQDTRDFYDMMLPRETEAYWFRAAAVKVIFESPQLYDIDLPDDGWSAAVCDTLLFSVHAERFSIKDLLEGSGLAYREFKELNPSFRRTYLPKGKHRLAIPRPSVAAILAEHPKTELITPRSPTQPAR